MSAWPKKVPELTEPQKAIKNDWVEYWLNTYGKKFGFVERFNHSYAANIGFFPHCKTLEIGAGLGDHLKYENVNLQEYTAVEIVPEYAKIIEEKYSRIRIINEDCQKRMPFDNNYFDRILAIHVLEHLPDLPRALDEFTRLLNKNGKFIAVIPCEGGYIYSLSR
jgi:ubiquinone/menaquinone biosynthesis C-methylase UbiE